MKAVICTGYGSPDVFELREVKKPVPKDEEVLIRIFASAVNSGDCRIRRADPWAVKLFFGFSKPRKEILGAIFSGVVEAVGKKVTKFKPGDEVFGSTGMNFGTYAEYTCIRENATITKKPENIIHTEAATIPFGALTAISFLRKAKIKKEDKILINGASGAVGTAAVQLAKHFGANVTGVCSRTNFDLVQSLGADDIIDYTTDDLSKLNGKFDVVFETVNKLAYSDCLKLISKNGKLILGAAGAKDTLKGLFSSVTEKHKVISGVASEKLLDLILLKELTRKGIYKPVVDRTYSLEQIPEAHRYVDIGHKKGNVAIKVV